MPNAPLTDHNCRNCGEKTTRNYCAHCGQANDGGETNWRFLVSSLLSIFVVKYMTDKKGTVKRYGVPETIWYTILFPAATIGEYLAGKHLKYYSPIAIFITLSGFYLLLGGLTGEYVEQQEDWFAVDAKTYFDQLLEYLAFHPVVRALLHLPFLVLTSKWFAGRESGFSYVQYLYLWIFVYIANDTLVLVMKGIDAYLIPLGDSLQITMVWGIKFLYGLIIFCSLTNYGWLQTTGRMALIWIVSLLMTTVAIVLLEIAAACVYYLMVPGDFSLILDQIMIQE